MQANVAGERCDQCRPGTFNLQQSNHRGCTECFCSGVTQNCAGSHLYREQIPMVVFQDQFTLTNRMRTYIQRDSIEPNIERNEFTSQLYDPQTYYWSLPERFLGNQIMSYGGQLNFTVTNEGGGDYVPDSDVILIGNGQTLSWTRKYQLEGVIIF